MYIFRWLEVITDWLQYSTDVYCIYYEVISPSSVSVHLSLILMSTQELTEAPTSEMRRLLEYLHLAQDEARLACIEAHSAGSFHRLSHQSEDPWSEELHTLINGVIMRANKLLVEKTGRPLPLEKYEYYQNV